LDRDENAAINILKRGLSTVGHTGTFGLDPINAWGENTSTFSEAILSFASNLCEPRIPVSLERGVSTPITFVSADNELNVAVISEGLPMENPNNHPS
jgi:hypothetical protein